ncbi:MAG: DNA-formamidopyrimidine glycosylase family protein [Vicinamibacterales bacterium]
MPEFPDVELYLHALRPRLMNRPIRGVRVASPFLVRTTVPEPSTLVGQTVTALRRIGKRIAIVTDGPSLLIHLMVAGRLQWRPPAAPIPARRGLMALDVDEGTLLLTEAGTTRRASVHVFADDLALASIDPGGLEVLETDLWAFRSRLVQERHTLKRALTDPRLLSGIGNAYSDEILHAAGLSPLRLTDALTDDEWGRLHDAARAVLSGWRDRLVAAAAGGFPERVTAFRDGMAVHGRYGQPCPRCATPVQRIRYAANEANYCPRCQTSGRLLADRGLSRLLKSDWPRSLDDLERRRADGKREVRRSGDDDRI